MAHAEFVHLRVHTAYSLLEGALRIGALVELCKQHRMPAVAITDTGNMFGVMEFAGTCMKGGVQPITGTALAVTRESGEVDAFGQGSARRPEPEVLASLHSSETQRPDHDAVLDVQVGGVLDAKIVLHGQAGRSDLSTPHGAGSIVQDDGEDL